MRRVVEAYLMLLCILGATACQDRGPDGAVSHTEWETVKVAVVAPLSASKDNKARYERTADWFLDNFRAAQTRLEKGISLELEWYDENAEDMKALGAELAVDSGIAAVIGPEYSVNVDAFAAAYSVSGKPLIAPVASSEEVVRKYSSAQAGTQEKSPFLWSLTEADISQSEVLLSLVTSVGGKSISLLASADMYGRTFTNWIPFLARELGLEVKSLIAYSDDAGLESGFSQLMHSGADYAICALGDRSDVLYVSRARKYYGDHAPRLLFSDSSLNADLLRSDANGEGIEGVSMYADPYSGFELSYTEKFGVPPNSVEPQFYDALMLVGFAAFHARHTGEPGLNNSIRTITSPQDGHPISAWNLMGMQMYLNHLEEMHMLLDLRGATGEIRFDQDALTSVLHSTYAHWVIHGGRIVIVDYASSDGSKRTEETMASWNWRAQMEQEIDDSEAGVSFGEMTGQWALLVAGSQGWSNYRHQADVLNVYQSLKRCGWDDSHIILVMRDDIAFNDRNGTPGVVRNAPEGVNLYADVELDYCADTLDVVDIMDILTGRSSSHLPQVLETDEGSNVLVYWTGHGEPGYFSWMEKAKGLSEVRLRNALEELSARRGYRKMLFCAEPCYSASMVKTVEGLDGILGVASASETEYSFADNYSVEMETWMSDRFTNNLIKGLSADNDLTYKELYSYLVSHTLGSHVGIYNAGLFGNLYREKPAEFFVYQDGRTSP